MPAYYQIFGTDPIILPVVGVEDIERAKANNEIAPEHACAGVFIINNAGSRPDQFLRIVRWLTSDVPAGWFIGANPLVPAVRGFAYLSPEIAGLWTDDALVDERRCEQPDADAVAAARITSGWSGLYFGVVAF